MINRVKLPIWFERLQDMVSLPHEIWHLLAARSVGVPRNAIEFSPRLTHIKERIASWKYVVIGSAPLMVWSPITALLFYAWLQTTSAITVSQFSLDALLLMFRLFAPTLAMPYNGTLASSLCAFATAWGLLYILSCLDDIFLALPYTLMHHDKISENRDAGQ